ncbi:MAG: serine/threonine protein kinase [Sandaracinaceae bacterium]|nr:serine/threonine protein kinase [Sandaracinaceae bacterium]
MADIPKSIGRYQVERLLGQGAMGSVYLGRDTQLDRAVAIKTVRHLDLEEKRLRTFIERFRNEARAAARLSHPSIVAVYDVGEDDAVGPYLVFEYVPGSSLKQILRSRGALPPEDAVRLARQIATAIDTAHQAGVIHRDVKPDNILVSATGDAKLADFGVARVPDAALTKEGQFLGTPCYAAPETLGQGVYGETTDMFSFAAVVYEAVSGVRAFPGDDAISVAHHVVHDQPEPPSVVAGADAKIPKAVDRVIMRGLDKDPEARYATATELVDAVASAYIEAGVLDRDPTGVQILPPPEPTSRGGSSWVFVLAVLGLLGVGVAFVIAFLDVDTPLNPHRPTPAALDAGIGDAGPDDAGPEDAGPDDGGVDASAPAPVDAAVDAGVDPNLPDVAQMSAFDRDEAAKDEVSRARRALDDGDLEAAALALARARAYDDGNSDIPDLEDRLDDLRDAAPAP